MLKVANILLVSVAASIPVHVYAARDITTFTDNNETKGYIGLQWFTEETPIFRPNIVIGIRNTKTSATDNKVTGYDAMLTYSTDKNEFDALRVGYIDGKCNALATAGLGYSFKKSTALGFVGAVGPYSRIIAELDGNMRPGLGIDLNSLNCAGDRNTVTPSGDAGGGVINNNLY